jgi:hypothetical protein
MKRDAARTASTPPDFLTVEEAAAILRIGRSTAYRLANLYLATGGSSRLLPVERCGKQLRVPRYKLEEILGGPITWPIVPWEPAGTNGVTQIAASDPARRRTSRTKPQARRVDSTRPDFRLVDASLSPSVEQLSLLPN